MTRLRRIGTAVSAFAIAGMVCVFPESSASADSVPFTDPNATGSIGFCDRAGHEVRSGSIDAAPFTWFAVSSTAAPNGYQPPQGRANLYAYQPIEHVDPGNWSGKSMTAASTFTSKTHPMAAGTVLDSALVDFIGAYPLTWDGLVQLRMLFSAPYQTLHSATYPAAVIRVSGHNWSLISGGGVPCNAGTAESVEVQRLPASAFKNQGRPSPVADVKKAKTSSSSAHPSGSSSNGSPSATAGSGDSAAGTSDVAKNNSSGGSGTTIALTVAACVAGAATAVAYWIRRNRRIGA